MVSTGSGGWVHEFPTPATTGADTEIVRRGGEISVIYFDGQNADVKYDVVHLVGQPHHRLRGLAVGFHNEIVEVGGTWYVGSYNYDRTLFIEPLSADPSAMPRCRSRHAPGLASSGVALRTAHRYSRYVTPASMVKPSTTSNAHCQGFQPSRMVGGSGGGMYSDSGAPPARCRASMPAI